MGKIQSFFKASILTLSLLVVFGFANISFAYSRYSFFNHNWNNWGDWHDFSHKDENKKPLVYLFATDYAIKAGEFTTMYWDAKRADSCSVSGDGWSGNRAVKAKEDVSPSVTTNYTITCSNEFGDYTDSAEITVMKGKKDPPPPPPEDNTPTLDFIGSPLSITQGDSSTLTWSSTNANACVALDGWSGDKTTSGDEDITPDTTTTYTLECGDGMSTTTSQSVTVTVSALGPQPLDHLIISEVYYLGPDESTEWVEIYNGTGSDVTMDGWTISDATISGIDNIPMTVIPNDSFAVIIGSTAAISVPADAQVITLTDNDIGSGLNNSGDTIYLKDATSAEIDSLSYGSITPKVFNPSISILNNTGSIKRINLTIDTNTAADWATPTTPTPGSF